MNKEHYRWLMRQDPEAHPDKTLSLLEAQEIAVHAQEHVESAWNTRMHFRTFAAAWVGLFAVAFCISTLGLSTGIAPVALGAGITTLLFYVSDKAMFALRDLLIKKREEQNANNDSGHSGDNGKDG